MSLHSLTKSLQPSILHICITSSLFNLLAALARHYRQHCAQRRPPVFNLLRRRFCGFSPRIGDTLHRWGWNLVRRRDRRSRPPRQTSPPSVQRQGCRTPKTEIFTPIWQNVEYKRPAWAYPLRDFHKICRVCTPFQDALAVKIWLDLVEGLWSYGGFKLRRSGYPQFSEPPSGETMRQTPKSFTDARTCSRSRQVWWGSDFTRRRYGQKRWVFVCLSVCLSVTLLNVRVYAPDFAMKTLEYINDFDAIG